MIIPALARWLWYSSTLLLAVLPAVKSSSTTIFTVQHEPNDWTAGLPPEKLAIVNMNLNGQQSDTALKYQSQFQHIGCYSASKTITMDAEQDTSFDPNACIQVCKTKYKDTPTSQIMAAVSGLLCGCVTEELGGMEQFMESDDYERDCNLPCKFFENLICGGPPDYWGVFKEYDYQSLASAGAYDPWRKVWYTIVVVLERTIDPTIGPKKKLPVKEDDTFVAPERYYLNAMEKTTGNAAFQYQIRLPGIIHGIQYDLDSSRLVGLLTDAEIGRVISPLMWKYYLITLNINTTNALAPNVSYEQTLPELVGAVSTDKEYFSLTGASAIVSARNQDTYVYTMIRDQGQLKMHKHYCYFVSIPDGTVIFQRQLDFRVLQFFSNEKYGDVTAFGYRYKQMQYLYLARVYFDLIEVRKRVLWVFEETRPEFLVPPALTEDFHLFPGGSCSEHLFNKSYSLLRNYSANLKAARPNDTGTLLMEVDIRNKVADFLCDKSTGCKTSMNITIPYAGIFNAEPRIPLSLAAPKLISARFSIDGGFITFVFDRATLKGASPIDINNDIVPDSINYDTTMKGKFGCDLIFDEDAVVLLGPFIDGTYCEWISESEVRTTLPSIVLPPIEVPNEVFLKSDVIYTVPRIETGEYSMSSEGGIQVDFPFPLLDPVIIFSGVTTVDECTGIYFNAGDSYNVGGKPVYNWTLVNVVDMTMRSDRILNATRMQLLRDNLANATKENFPIFAMSSKEVEPAVRFDILLTITSRWGKNVTKMIELNKLDYPAPAVEILGEVIQDTKRPLEVSMLSVGTASKCPGISRQLGYKWEETTAQLDLSTLADVVTTTRSLVIPPFTLHPGDPVNEYNFTVTCYVFDDATRYDTKTVTVRVSRSQVVVRLAKEDRLLTRGKPAILDARESQDVDYPTFSGQTFKGTFLWWCLGPGQQPCYDEMSYWNSQNASVNRELAPMGSTLGITDNLTFCKTDINNKIVSAGRSFSAPQFVSYSFCKWARGVFMGDTSNFTEGNYTFTIEAVANDGRTSRKEIVITITRFEVPAMMLTIKAPKEKFPVTESIRLEGLVENKLPPEANPRFSWQILLYGLNNQWNAEEARQAEIENRIYQHQKFIYIDVSDVLDISNQSRFKTRPDIPNMMIFPNVVKPSQRYKVRLIATLYPATPQIAFVDVSFQTAGLAPRPGQLTVDPRNGTMLLNRIAAAPDWKAEDLPLKYHFGYWEILGNTEIQLHFDTAPLPISQTTFNQLPIGDPSTNYSLTVFVDVISKFGAKTTHSIQIQSRPPANKTAVINEIFARIRSPGADPEQTVKDLNTLLNVVGAPALTPGATISPADEAIMAEVIKILQKVAANAPVTKQMQIQQAKILVQVIQSGYKTMDTMDGLESMILNSAQAGLFNIQDLALMQAAFHAIGGVMPDLDRPASASIPVGGRRLTTEEQGEVSQRNRGHPHRKFDADGIVPEFANLELSRTDLEFVISTSFGREETNHPRPWGDELVISSCPTAYCDWTFLKCVRELNDAAGATVIHTCCVTPNSLTGCADPPCWFRGSRCPFQEDTASFQSELDQRRLQTGQLAGDLAEWQWSEDQGYGSLIAAETFKMNRRAKNYSNASLQEKLELQLSLAGLDSDNNRMRQLSSRNVSRGIEPEAKIALLEVDEAPMLEDVQLAIKEMDRRKMQLIRADARLELHYKLMEPGTRIEERTAFNAQKQVQTDQLRELERSYSQIITRSAVLRDTICKQALVQMTTSVEVLRFDTPSFIIWMGKTRNMSEVRPSLIFPDKFIVPSDTPDEPTVDNPLTAFAYVYIEYKKNIYGWSDSAPPGNESTIITLNIMQANTREIEVKNETDPIRVFADLSLFSSALCMFWDRFAPNTAGGAWSTRGVLNDGEGCLTTHLSDLALFIDGRIPMTYSVDKAVSYYLEDIIDGPEGSKYNWSSAAVVGFVILLGSILALVGYIQDELIRERQRLGKSDAATHFLDGDGISAPLSVDDAIAYDYIGDRHLFLVFTLWKVVLRDHALLGVFHYNAAFTRPQRILCLGVMATSILAVNAMIYGIPREYVADDQWFPSGVISGLMSFPIFVGCIFMFAARPTPMRKRLIKRKTNTAEVEAIARVRLDIEHESAMMYPKGLMALPQYPQQHVEVGRTTLLALPAPIMPRMPQVPQPGMALLPPPPQAAQLPVAGLPALAGLPSLPPLPALKPGPGLAALPPPPKYHPPMARMARAGLPEPGARTLPPPPPPPLALGQPPQDGLRMAALAADVEIRTPPGTRPHSGGSANFAPDGVHGALPMDVDTDLAPAAQRNLQTEGEHGMHPGAPPLPPLGGPPSGPPGVPALDMTQMDATGESGIFCTPRTPVTQPPSSHGTNFMPQMPYGLAPMQPTVQGISMTGIVHRGEPPAVLPPPAFLPGIGLGLPPLPGLPPMLPIRPPMGFGLPPGMPQGLPPGMIPPPSVMMRMPGAMMVPGSNVPQPPPPPPPKEDDAVFLRRARLHYMERAAKHHQDMMLDHGQDPPKDIPNWIFSAMTLCPYIACAVSMCFHIQLTVMYSLKFQRIAELYWYYSSVVGMGVVLVILELMRSAVMTIVELRKFEIRRRLVGGDFNKSRIKPQSSANRDPMHPKKDKRKPSVPIVPPKKPLANKPPPPPKDFSVGPPPGEIDDASLSMPTRPGFLPAQSGDMPFLRTAGGAGLPVGPPPPPPGKPPGRPGSIGPGSMGMPPPGVPHLDLRGPPMTPPGVSTPLGQGGGSSLLPGKMGGRHGSTPPLGTPPGPGTPTLGMSFGSTMGQTPPPMPPMPGGMPGGRQVPASPTGSVASQMSKSLSEKMAANRTPGATPPPPVPGARGPTPPGSHRSGGSGRGARPPPAPPPAGQSAVERSRAAKRGQ